MRCPPVCPTGALTPITSREQAGMGLAVIDKKRCLTFEGSVFCKTCHEKCPLRGAAMIMDMGLYPTVTDKCVGCGVCENVCPVQAIVTLSRADLPGNPPGVGGA
jgi:ferredoxin-type protein NapG